MGYLIIGLFLASILAAILYAIFGGVLPVDYKLVFFSSALSAFSIIYVWFFINKINKLVKRADKRKESRRK